MNEQITASGQGEAKAMPDFAALTLTVTAEAADQAEAVRQNAENATAVTAALRELGIADKDVQTQQYTVQPQYNRQKKPPTLSGYWVQNRLQVTVRDLDRVGFVIDKVAANGALSLDYISFGLSDRAEADAEALSQAVVSARRRAGVMAAAAGVGLGRLLSMTEGASDGFPSSDYAEGMLSSAPAAAETPISAQQVTINASVTLVYAMGAAR